jgi:hypothetical protein
MTTTGTTTAAYAVQGEKPTKPDKYCYTVISYDPLDPSQILDTDESCYPKKQQCEQNRPGPADEFTVVTECTKVEK